MEASALVEWLSSALRGGSSPEESEPFIAKGAMAEHGLGVILDVIRRLGAGRQVLASSPGAIAEIISVTIGGSGPNDVALFDCHLDGRGRLLGLQPAPVGVSVEIHLCRALEAKAVADVHDLFDATYARADHTYLDRSLSQLPYIATAVAGDRLVGFSLGDAQTLDLPSIGTTHCLLSGLVCVDEAHRRRGLSRHLSSLAVRGGGVPMADSVLAAARMAHPSSMRAFGHSPATVPRLGHSPTEVQRACGAIVASALGASEFDGDTFVCRGSGRPIGDPRMVHDVDPEEWELFEHVDRGRGDSLLALTWQGATPSSWQT